MAKMTETAAIELPRLDIRTIELTLIGDSPLVCHRWSEKMKEQLRDKHQKRAKAGRPVRDPEAEFRASLYEIPSGGYGFPAVAFKTAAVDACSHIAGVTKVQARGAFHVVGELAPIDGDPEMREDTVRVGMGAADLRYRGQFFPWRTRLRVRYNASVLSAEQVTNLFNTAGFAIGVGEHRPQRDGSWGMFHVATDGEI